MATLTADQSNIVPQFAALKDGDTLQLQGTILDWRPTRRVFATPVTIDATQAKVGGISGALCEGMNWQLGEVTLGAKFFHGIRMDNSKRLRFEGVRCAGGSMDLKAAGLRMISCSHVELHDTELSNLLNGVVFGECTDVVVNKLTVSKLGSDGLDLFGVMRARVTNVRGSDFTPYMSSHPDLIQLASQKDKIRTTDIHISDVKGWGSTQGVTAFNHPEVGQQGFGVVVIEDVDLELMYPQGCAVYDCDDLTLRNVTTRTAEGSKYQCRINVFGAGKLTRQGCATLAGAGKPAEIDADWNDPRIPTLEQVFTADQARALRAWGTKL